MYNNLNILTSDELNLILYRNNSNNKIKEAAELIVQSINDWPASINEPKQLLEILSNEICKPLTVENIKTYAQSLEIANNMWKIEATSSILEIFKYDENKTLDAIISDITDQYRST